MATSELQDHERARRLAAQRREQLRMVSMPPPFAQDEEEGDENDDGDEDVEEQDDGEQGEDVDEGPLADEERRRAYIASRRQAAAAAGIVRRSSLPKFQPLPMTANEDTSVMNRKLFRIMTGLEAFTLVGLIVAAAQLHLQWVCGNILGMKRIPKLELWEIIFMVLIDLLLLAALLTVFVLFGIIILGPLGFLSAFGIDFS